MEEKGIGDLPWDRPKPDPDDLDLFAGLPIRPPAVVTLPVVEDEPATRLALARIAARPILEDPPPVKG